MNILITRIPGVGKTTILEKVKNSLEEYGCHIGELFVHKLMNME